MNIIILAYRDWAVDVYKCINEYYADIHVDLFAHQPNVDLGRPIFAVGWSEKIKPLPGSRWFVVHPSKLPEYRGGSPIQHQIMDGAEWMTVSIFELTDADAPMDSGPIAWQSGPFPVGPDSSLDDILYRISVQAEFGIATVVRHIAAGTLKTVEQDHSKATSRKRRTPEESEIRIEDFLTHTARQMHDKIRALQDPYPNAWIECADGTRLYITHSSLVKKA